MSSKSFEEGNAIIRMFTKKERPFAIPGKVNERKQVLALRRGVG